jgi:hypothetical protein
MKRETNELVSHSYIGRRHSRAFVWMCLLIAIVVGAIPLRMSADTPDFTCDFYHHTITAKEPYIELKYADLYKQKEKSNGVRGLQFYFHTSQGYHAICWIVWAHDCMETEYNGLYGTARIMSSTNPDNDHLRYVTVRLYPSATTMREGIDGVRAYGIWDVDGDQLGKYQSSNGTFKTDVGLHYTVRDDNNNIKAYGDYPVWADQAVNVDIPTIGMNSPQAGKDLFYRSEPGKITYGVSGVSNSGIPQCDQADGSSNKMGYEIGYAIGTSSPLNYDNELKLEGNMQGTKVVQCPSNKDKVIMNYRGFAYGTIDVVNGSYDDAYTNSYKNTIVKNYLEILNGIQTYTVKGCLYPASLKCQTDMLKKYNLLTWTLPLDANERLSSGSWYVFRKSDKDPTEVLIATLSSQTTQYEDDKAVYDTKYTYTVCFGLTDWNISSPVSDLSRSIQAKISRSWNLTATAKGTAQTIIVECNYPDCNSGTDLKLLRSTDGGSSYSILTTFPSINTTGGSVKYTDADVINDCASYKYKFTAKVMDMDFTSEPVSANITDKTQVTKVDVSKGFYDKFVRITWDVHQAGTDAVKFIVQRKLLNSDEDYTNIYITQGSSSEYYYDDNTAAIGQYYQYNVKCYSKCAGQYTFQNDIADNGFCQSTGTLSGRITYGTGVAVSGARIDLTRGSDNSIDKAQFYSMKFAAQNAGLFWNADTTKLVKLFEKYAPFSIQMYVQPEANITRTSTSNVASQPMLFEAYNAFGLFLKPDSSKMYTVYMRLPHLSGTAGPVPYRDVSSNIDIAANEFSHLTLSADEQGTWTLRKTDADGKIKSFSVKGCEPVIMSRAHSVVAFGSSVMNDSAYTFKGYIDEIRVWSKALTDAEVLSNYNHTLSGTESGLKLYWPLDEGIERQSVAYDYSKTGGIANGNVGTIIYAVADSSHIPTNRQLGLFGITDNQGNYVIRGVPFAGDGTNYIITPSLGKHEFSPANLTRLVSNNSISFSAVDFSDISSFKVKGVVYYKNTLYPVAGATFSVDGTTCAVNGKPCQTADDGTYTISVPIGRHYIQIEKSGHVFCDNGRYPADPDNGGKTLLFTDSISNLTFSDSTLVTVAGRIVGGNIENDKPLGFKQSVNNIGKAQIILTAGTYSMNVYKKTNGATYSYEYNSSNDSVASPTTNINSSSYRKGGNIEDTKLICITTDPATGEFAALLPPVQYDVKSINVLSNKNISFDTSTLPILDASSTRTVYTDSITDSEGKVEKFTYSAKLKKPYYSTPILTVKDTTNNVGAYGIESYSVCDVKTKTSTDVPIYTVDSNDKLTYNYKYPVFVECSKYKFKIKGYEEYSNYDADASKPVVTRSPLSKLSVTINNEMSSDQGVYVEEGVVNGKKVEPGNLIDTTSCTIELDSLGETTYVWTAGLPNIIDPFTRGINIYYDYNGRTYEWSQNGKFKGIIFGNLPSGTNFVTAGPDRLLMVLRDPPGTASYSYWEAGSSRSWTADDTNSEITTAGEETESKLGVSTATIKGTPAFGIITELKETYNLKVGLELNYEHSYNHVTTHTLTASKRIQTSPEVDFVGAPGDLFIGNSTNQTFGVARTVSLKKNTITKQYELGRDDGVSVNESFNTDFAYTQNYIQNTLIPNLQTIRNSYLTQVTQAEYMGSYTNNSDSLIYITTLDPSDSRFGSSNEDAEIWKNLAILNDTLYSCPSYRVIKPKNAKNLVDRVEYYNSQIVNWTNVLMQNEESKLNATNIKNYSFDAGAGLDISNESDTTETSTHTSTFHTMVTGSLATGVVIAGTGVIFNTSLSYTQEGAYARTHEVGATNKIGFALAETGDDDALSVDVGDDPHGYGPVFRLRGGQTCCPYEGETKTQYYKKGSVIDVGTMQIEKPTFVQKQYVATDVPTGKKATFYLKLANLSETHENVWFDLKPLDSSNPNGALLTLATGPLGNGHTVLVNAEDTLKLMVQLAQSNTDVLNYEKIGIVLASQCQNDPTGVNPVIADTCYLTAHFVPTSSDVSLNIENTEMNMFTGDTLQLSIRDYDAAYKNLKAVRLQYKGTGDTNWNLAKEYVIDSLKLTTNNEMLPSGGIITIRYPMHDASLFPDGTYQFRAITACNYGTDEITKSSDIITVVKDMIRPKQYGKESPADGILTSNDDISVTFNEDINSSKLDKASFIITGKLNGSQLDHNVALKMEGTEKAAYTESPFMLSGKSFSASTWFTYNGAGTLFRHGYGTNKFKVGTNDTGHLVVEIGNSTYTSTNTVPADEWTFLAFAYNHASSGCTFSASAYAGSTSITLFNETPVAEYNGTGNIAVGENLHGAIQELALYDRARTMAEALAEKSITKTPSEENLIGYWKFDEGEGKKATDYARSRNMILPVANWYLNNANKAFTLSGTNYLTLPIGSCSALPTDDYLYEMWFSGDKQSADATLFSVGDGRIAMNFDASGHLQLVTDSVTTALGSTNYLDKAWHHVALNVQRSGYATTYIDGVQISQMSASALPTFEGSEMYLGAIRYTNAIGNYAYRNFFKGYVDEVRFWKADFTANVIRDNRTQRVDSTASGLVAYYPFETTTVDTKNSQVVAQGSIEDASKHTNLPAKKARTNEAVVYSDNAPALKPAAIETNVDYSYVASDRGIVITLNESPAKIEDCTVKFIVRNVYDTHNNISEPVIWSAYVNQNLLKWNESGISLTQKNLESTTFSAVFTNKSSKAEKWSLSGLPTWLSPDIESGTLQPLTSETINFTVAPSTPIGNYEETIYLTGNNAINEPYTVKLYVKGDEPTWSVDPSQFENSMNVIGHLKVNGIASEDVNDKVAAFVNGKCVGVASPIYYSRYDSYFIIMDVYGNASDAGKAVTFKVWDASTGTIYPTVSTSSDVTFIANNILGNMATPLDINAENKVEQDISLTNGWNWMSLYAKASDMSTSSVLSGIKNNVSIIKGKTSFEQPSGTRWMGTLETMSIGEMYKLKTKAATTLSLTGEPAIASKNPITVKPGWNWIGCNTAYTMTVTDAFAGLSPVTGDEVKGQTGFALYQDYEWIGSLKTIVPGKGYMLYSNSSQNRTFCYPSAPSVSVAGVMKYAARYLNAFNPIDEGKYPGNMTIVARIESDGTPLPNTEVGVFSNDECRTAEVSDSDGYAFLTVPGEGTGAPLSFKIYTDGKIIDASQTLVYTDDSICGDPENPFIVNILVTGIDNAMNSGNVNVYPQIVKTKVFVDAAVPLKRITIIDNAGRVLRSIVEGFERHNVISMNAYNRGLYFIKVETEGHGTFVKRIIK